MAAMAVALATLACSVFVGGPDYPQPPVAASTQTAQDAQSEIDRAIAESVQTGSFKLALTESQVTAYVAAKLDAQPRPAITDPQVVLREGVIALYGRAQSGIFVAHVRALARATVDESGVPQIEITQAEFGPIPMPDSLTNPISALLQETLTGSLGPAATGFRLESIDIADGVMTVTGRTK